MSLSCVIFVREAGRLKSLLRVRQCGSFCLWLSLFVWFLLVLYLFCVLFELRADEFEDVEFVSGYGALVVDHTCCGCGGKSGVYSSWLILSANLESCSEAVR